MTHGDGGRCADLIHPPPWKGGAPALAIACSIALLGTTAPAQESARPEAESRDKPKAGRVDYAPGIVIDWSNRRVELAAEVVFREGPLELLACSPHTREHESILVVQARPLRIFEALGLIGLEPGAPPTYDGAADRWNSPTGQRVRIEIRVGEGQAAKTVAPDAWLWDIEKDRPASGQEWLFCGSAKWPDGAFGADTEGTVISVVDFPTSLIGLKQPHTAENEHLWCRANTDAIPPVGARCTLLVAPATDETEPRP